MITVLPLTIEHIKTLTDPATEPGLKDLIASSRQYWQGVVDSGHAFAGLVDGELIGCAGYSQPWQGVAEVWVWDTPKVHDHPMLVHKLIHRTLKRIEKEHDLWRVSCEVRVGNERAVRWVELMGFKYEGTMKKRGPDGSDFYLYAKVRD